MKRKILSIIIAIASFCTLSACDTSSKDEIVTTAEKNETTETITTTLLTEAKTQEITTTEATPIKSELKFGVRRDKCAVDDYDFSAHKLNAEKIKIEDSVLYKLLKSMTEDSFYIIAGNADIDMEMYLAHKDGMYTIKMVSDGITISMYYDKEYMTYYYPASREAIRIKGTEDDEVPLIDDFDELFLDEDIMDEYINMVEVEVDGENYICEFLENDSYFCFDSEGNFIKMVDDTLWDINIFTSEIPSDAFIQPTGYHIEEQDDLSES